MSTGREMMRVSDAERQVAADRLRAAMGEGRLDLLEYDNRLGLAYQAVTYADLDKFFTDLPAHGATSSAPAVAARTTPAAAARSSAAARTGFAGLPLAMKILWTIWGAVVAINLTVWLLVGIGADGGLPYFWPMWLAVPGGILLAVSAGVSAIRNSK